MNTSLFSEEDILAVLGEVKAGASVQETCTRYGISEATYDAWKSKYDGMQLSQLRQLRKLEAENLRLRMSYADPPATPPSRQDAAAGKI